MQAFNLSDISNNLLEEVRNIQLKFNNGDELFISVSNIFEFNFHIVRTIVVDDYTSDIAFQINSGYINIDKFFLQKVLGTKELYKLFNKGKIISLKIEYDDLFKITSVIPVMFCVFDERSNNALEYEETTYSIIIRWAPEVVDVIKSRY